jgi:hypothetical protein
VSAVNVDVLGDGERAARSGELATTRAVEAGQCADVQLWRAAIRSPRARARAARSRGRRSDRAQRDLRPRPGRVALDQHPEWVAFACRSAQIVIGDLGCASVGPVLELPIAMAMIVLRRARWSTPRERATEPMTVRVTFAGHQRVRLDEHGEWEPIIGE